MTAKVKKSKEDWYLDFYTEVCSKSNAIDLDEEQDWTSLSIGWAIAKGMSIVKAHDFSLYARYNRQYKA